MPTFTLTNKAIADLKDIGRYTLENWGREQRNLYLGMLVSPFSNWPPIRLQVRTAAIFGMATENLTLAVT